MVPVQAQSFVVVFHLVEAASVMMFALNLVIVAMMLNWFVHVSICECMHACMLIIIDLLFVQLLITALHCHFKCNQVLLHQVCIMF